MCAALHKQLLKFCQENEPACLYFNRSLPLTNKTIQIFLNIPRVLVSFEGKEYYISTCQRSNSETVFIFYLITVDSWANWQIAQVEVLRKILFYRLN